MSISDSVMVAIIASVSIASCTACSVADKIAGSERDMTSQQICVRRALTQNDRMQCLGAKP